MGRVHLADGHGTLVVYTANEQRLAVFGLASWNRIRRDVAAAYRHPFRFAAAKNLRKAFCKLGNARSSWISVASDPFKHLREYLMI